LNPKELFYHRGNWAILFPAGGWQLLRQGSFVHLRIPKIISIGVMLK